MAEDKKAFLQGKMNKDIDARLLPNGEYRTAQNIQVSTSEAQDVGTIQNLKGNTLIKLFPDINSTYGILAANLETIGCHFDEANDRAFYFITNYTCADSNKPGLVGGADGPTLASVANTTSRTDLFCAILLFTESEGIKVLCQGLFLNFSKTHEITGVNILNDLLFFTDNFNQPRRISITRALADSTFYDDEQKISVAKFAPVFPLRLLDQENNSTMSTDDNIDSDFLENQFVRFSYRFRYIDGEYSVMAPFTQAVFIPEIYEKTSTGFTIAEVKAIFQTGEVEGMVNCINKVVFKLQMPTASITAFSDYQIKEIQLLCKVDGDLPVRVLDVISSSTSLIDSSGVINYTYESSEPFKTLPQNQITRVFDNVPLKAQSQEVIGNRIVYGNYFEKRDLSESELDFEVNTATKNSSDSSSSDFLHNEYKYHSVKQRRKYQVGIVLSDIFGRQSPVLLPRETSSKTSLQRSSVFVPPKKHSLFDSSVWADYADNSTNTTNWGDVLRIRFDDIIGNAYSATNLYGWYSYRVVVQQQEQEYYNVYTSGAYISGNYGFIAIEGDNVNKVPRDVTDIKEEEGVVGSEVKLYPKIINYNTDEPIIGQYNPNNGSINVTGPLMSVISIGNKDEHNFSATIPGGFSPFLISEDSKVLLAKINITDQPDFPTSTTQGGLAVFEIEPFDSKIDIFFETSTSGLVNDLNTVIAASQTGLDNIEIEIQSTGGRSGLTEGSLIGDVIGKIVASNSAGQQAATITLLSVEARTDDTDFETVNDYFEIDSTTSAGDHFIKTKRLFWFIGDGLRFKFNVLAEFGGASLQRSITTYALEPGDQIEQPIKVKNEFPAFTNNGNVVNGTELPLVSISQTTGQNVLITQVSGVNGTADTNNNTENLTFEITSQQTNNEDVTNFTINRDTGEISTTNFADLEPQTTYNTTVAVFETWANIDTSQPPEVNENPYAVVNLDIRTDTGTSLVEFFMSSVEYSSATDALSGTAATGAFLEGTGPLPTHTTGTDKIYIKIDGILVPLDTGEKFRTMSTISGTSEGSFKTNSEGIVIATASN